MLLQVNNVHVHYGGVKALDGASVSLDEGEVVAFMGPNGAGKSTILKAIFGLAPLESGEVRWHGAAIKPVPHEIVARGISFVPQGRRVFTGLNVEENLEVGGFLVKDKTERKRRIVEVMDFFPVLKHKRSRSAGMLSGGEQQMLAIARGMITEPKVLLLDEPSLGLAPKIVKEVFAKIKEISDPPTLRFRRAGRHRTAILIVEHNLVSLLSIASRAYVLDKGKVVAEGESKKIVESGILEKVFLGKA
ncbi:MAG: ABC transporter ATP-binding protein [Candidatus Liptonbacteria bacterium]|nr:ABC transporter ATP-binding protein [Candidatus Liptonbacteria bacterium]